MWYLIVTARSILWMLISLLATLLMLGAFMSPMWLVKGQQQVHFPNETITYTASVGVYTKCSKPLTVEGPPCTAIAVRGLATDSNVFPGAWKAATVFLITGGLIPAASQINSTVSGLMIMSATVFLGLVSCRVQSLFKKSIFTMSGAAQAVAGKLSERDIKTTNNTKQF